MRLFSSVNSRIFGAFGILTAILVVVSAASIALMANAEHLSASFRAQARQTLEINDYLTDVRILELSLAKYLLAPSPEGETAVNVMIDDVATTDADGAALFNGDPEFLAGIDEVTVLANSYRDIFAELVAGIPRGIIASKSPQAKVLATMGPQMNDVYTAMADRIEAAQNALADNIARQEQLQLLIIGVISAVGVLAGAALALVTGRWLSGTFNGLTRTMGQLTAGEYDITIEGTKSQNVLGEMARALETFRLNGQQVAAADRDKLARAAATAERAAMMARFQSAFDQVIEKAMAGDFTGRIDEQFGDAEIDRIAANLNGMLESILQALNEADHVLAALAMADLRERMVGDYRGAFGKLKSSTNSVADKLDDILHQLRETSRSLKTATGEILAGANDLSDRTTKQAATIEETSAAMEQMSHTVKLNADRAHDASGDAMRVTQIVEASSVVMGKATEAMERISTSSAKISNIIGLIDDVAFQTNLLALNASVEAARAGDAGKGFAVVAVEVRRLAQSAAQASSDVKKLIEESAGEVQSGTRLVADVAGRLGEIIEGVRHSAKVMETIASDSQEQAAGIGQVNVAVRQMDEMTQQNAALVEEMNASIEQTEGQANQLDDIVATFTLSDVPVGQAQGENSGSGARAMLNRVKNAAKSYFGAAA